MLLTVCRNWSIFGAIRSMVGPPDSWNDANFCAPLRGIGTANQSNSLPSRWCSRQEAHDSRGAVGCGRVSDICAASEHHDIYCAAQHAAETAVLGSTHGGKRSNRSS